MVTKAGRKEGPPPGCMSKQQVQAGLGAINHLPPLTPHWKSARSPCLSWATPKGQQSQMLGKAGWEALLEQEPEHQIPELRTASHTRATVGKPQATETPNTQGGERERQGEITSGVGGRPSPRVALPPGALGTEIWGSEA